jgi:hypothetical protein
LNYFVLVPGTVRAVTYFYICGTNQGGRPMTTPAEYREIAEDCRQAMRAATSPEVRTELLQLARRWEEVAEQAERRRPAPAVMRAA